MRLGKDLIGKPIYSITDGKHLGTLKDLYIDLDLGVVNGIYLGSEGLIKKKYYVVQRKNIAVYGIDAILTSGPDVVEDSIQMPSIEGWLRRESFQGKEVDTPGGTKVGTVGDVILNDQAKILGYSLLKVHVAGPVAEHRQVFNEAVLEISSGEGSLVVDLSKAEKPLPPDEPAGDEEAGSDQVDSQDQEEETGQQE